MKSDGKHAAPCGLCGEPHYRQVNYCKRCHPAVQAPSMGERMRPVAERMSDEALRVFVDVYLARHAARVQAVSEAA